MSVAVVVASYSLAPNPEGVWQVRLAREQMPLRQRSADARVGGLGRYGAPERRKAARLEVLLDVVGEPQQLWLVQEGRVHPEAGRLALGRQSNRDRDVRVAGDGSGRTRWCL